MLPWPRNTGIVSRLRSDLRSALELGAVAPLKFRAARRSSAYRAAYEKDEPLVSICTPTYNRARILIERAVASSLGQTYRNIEHVVVGDGCSDETAELMAGIDDPRLRFVNLERRGDYPADPEKRWHVAGADAVNHAFAMSRGDFITQLDDDDMHTPDRIEKLVELVKRRRADLVYHPFAFEEQDGTWRTNEAHHFRLGQVTPSSIFFHRWFLNYPVDKASIMRFAEPGDWNRLRKYRYLGARIERHPEVMLRHFKERSHYGR
jgi:glycosyltransferase involved in cell wall biosynthesis